ncbi:hypothetical protein [Streptomyces sp. NPDC090025]|uniref:hypothetical protein n=1 Tax=Streptomyces sp. NPDC090025 TaxID=3365922 RepID=UPI0038373DEA
MLYARLLGAWWWLPGAGLVLLAAYGMWAGHGFYGANTGPVLPLAVLFAATALRLPPHEPRDARRTAPLLLAAIATAWPGAYLAYTRGLYTNDSWRLDEAVVYAALKESALFESVFFVWTTAAAGLALGAAAGHWLLPHLPVLGRRGPTGDPRAVLPTPGWLRRLTVQAFALVVLPLAGWLAVEGRLGLPDRDFTDPPLRAMATYWTSNADEGYGSCSELSCTKTRLGVAYQVDFHVTDSPAAAATALKEATPANARQISHQGTEEGYSYLITTYDGHDGKLVWTHRLCSCYATITLHNNQRGYEEAVNDFWYATDLTEPKP